MNLGASLFDDLVSQDGDARHSLIDCATVRTSLESDGIALTPPLLGEAQGYRTVLGVIFHNAR